MRREILRAYIYALLSEGAVRPDDLRQGLHTIVACVTEDVRGVLEDVAGTLVQYGTLRARQFAQQKYDELAAAYRKGGLGGLWDAFAASYQRGVDAKAGGRQP